MQPTDALISKFILVPNSTCFGKFLCPSSGVFHCIFGTGLCYTGLTSSSVQDQNGTSSILILHASCRQTCITCASTEYTVENSWWWAGKFPETCRIPYQNKLKNYCICCRRFRQNSRQFQAHSSTFRCWGSFASFQTWGTPGGGSWNVLITGPPSWGVWRAAGNGTL